MRRPYSSEAKLLVALLGLLFAATPAIAVPPLQLYVEGATYDTATANWTFTGDNFKRWVLGDVGHYGTIGDVRLTAAYATGLTGSISLTPALAAPSLLPSPGDPSLPPTPSLVGTSLNALSPSSACGPNDTVGTLPCMGSSGTLPKHGEYGSGVQWVEFALGDFTKTDSPIGDYIGSSPSTFPDLGQIDAYNVTISGLL